MNGFTVILAIVVVFIILMVIISNLQASRDIKITDRIKKIQREIIKAKTEDELITLSLELTDIFKTASGDDLKVTINTLISVIKDKIDIDFKD